MDGSAEASKSAQVRRMGRDVPEGRGNAERGGKKREEGKEGVRKMIEAGEKMSSLSQLALLLAVPGASRLPNSAIASAQWHRIFPYCPFLARPQRRA